MSEKKKIALVVHRYGREVCGGAEQLCRLYAEKLINLYDVEILTTTAIDDSSWANYYPAGDCYDGEILVRRFRVENVRETEWDSYLLGTDLNKLTKEEEFKILVGVGPYSPALVKYIRHNYQRYKAVIFYTYYYYPFSVGSIGIPNAILLPTAHDEAMIHLAHYKSLFSDARAFIFNTEEERSVVENIIGGLNNIPNCIGGVGYEVKNRENRGHIKLPEKYIVYAGRISEAKNCDELVNFFVKYKKEYPSELKLVFIGKRQMELPKHDDILDLGFVSDSARDIIVSNALLLVQPSRHESLSMICLEAMSYGVPILVTSFCQVLKAHVDKSKTGYTYSSYSEFKSSINDCLNNEGKWRYAAQKYIRTNYSWDVIMNKICRMIDLVGSSEEQVEDKICELEGLTPPSRREKYKESIPFVLAADDNYVNFLTVTLQSIVDNSDGNLHYDCIILSDGICDSNKALIKKLYQSANFSIRFVECSSYLNSQKFIFNNKQLSRSTFSRLLTLNLLSKLYKKVLYLDCDILVRRDIADLYSIDIKNNLFAAVVDPHIDAIKKYRNDTKKYLAELLGSEAKYFNAGVLLINLEELRKTWTTEQLISLACSRKWQWEDQDVLNKIAIDRVMWIDLKWNALWVNDRAIQNIMEANSLEYSIAITDPFIVHYAGGTVPVKLINTLFIEEFWLTARKTPFYESLLRQYLRMFASNTPINALPVTSQKEIVTNLTKVKNYYRCYGFTKTVKKVIVKLFRNKL